MIQIEFLIPRNTPITNLYKQVYDLGINARLIKSINLTIPEGHKGLAYMRVSAPGFIIAPSAGSAASFVRGDKQTMTIDVNRKIDGPPYNLICEGYNLDPFLPHTFILTITEV